MSFDYGAITGPLHEWERSWPYRLSPRDPYCGDEILDVPANYQNYVVFSAGEPLEELAFRAWDDAFLEAYRALLNGEEGWKELDLAAAHLQIDLPIRHDHRPCRIAPWPLPDSRLSDAVENWVPDIGLLAPDRVLGPWADEPLSPWLRALCGKVLCFSPLLAPAVRPMGRECRSRPRPDLNQRRVLIAMMRAPTMLWQTDPLTPLLPLSPRWIPDQPVSGLPDTPAFVGRIYKTSDAWQSCCLLPLPLRPDPTASIARLWLEYMRMRRFERRISWEDLLRDRGEVLYRSLCEQLWIRKESREAASALWSASS